jgi:hypothetical protein
VSRSDPLRSLSDKIRPLALARDHSLPLSPALRDLVPSGAIQRGSTVLVTADAGGPQGATSLAFALLAAASDAGSWCAAVGFPDLGAVAVAELGVDLDRLALVPRPEPAQWISVMGALLDAVDVVIVRPPARLRVGDCRRLTARARERKTVLIPVGSWVEGADVRLTVTGSWWEGLGAGDGCLRTRRLEVTANGRGAAARPHHATLWLPHDAAAYAGADADLLPDPAPAETGPLRSAG